MIAIIFTFLLFLLKVQCAKSPKKQSVEVYFLYTDGTELTKTYSIRLFFGGFAHWEHTQSFFNDFKG